MKMQLPFTDHIDYIENPWVRYAFGSRFKFFIHVTGFENIDSIRQSGLKPNELSFNDAIPRNYLKDEYKGIICLHPLGSDTWPKQTSSEKHYESIISLAIKNEYLPKRVGIDLSYYGSAEPSSYLGYSAADISVNLATKNGSIACYSAISADQIRVFSCQSSPTDPSSWPSLLYTKNDDVYRQPTVGRQA